MKTPNPNAYIVTVTSPKEKQWIIAILAMGMEDCLECISRFIGPSMKIEMSEMKDVRICVL